MIPERRCSCCVLAVAPDGIPRLGDTRIDAGVLAFTLAVSLATGIVVGLIPALRAARSDLSESLKAGRSAAAGSGPVNFRGALVVAEVAIALVVVVCSGLLTQSLWRMMAVDRGFDSDGAALRLSLPTSRYSDPGQRADFYDGLVERVSRLPGVESVGAANQLPMTGMFNISYEVAGRGLPGSFIRTISRRWESRSSADAVSRIGTGGVPQTS